ncbi:MAG TPA: hypothetical protein VL793_09360, partial [Patescibacteria group bacterium]|nr:hypothetical protein [Patescibacteria group bacterium]
MSFAHSVAAAIKSKDYCEVGIVSHQDLDSRIAAALEKSRALLLSLRTAESIWTGDLSASALSTATAVVALDLVKCHAATVPPGLDQRVKAGIAWLLANANADGGWGDTVQSHSNISTTTLVWAALTGPGSLTSDVAVIKNAENWLIARTGSLEPDRIAAAIVERYGTDRTFSAPILTHCALSGRFGEGREAWRRVIPLPFELAAFPARWFGALRLPVVSYALPALIAIGYARHYHAPSANPLARWVRSFLSQRVFRVLD